LAYNNLQALADENLIESIREHSRWQEGTECIEESGALLLAAAGRFPGPYLNCMIRTDPNVSAQHVLDHARDFYDSRDRGFILFVRSGQDSDLDDLCQANSLMLLADVPPMTIDEPFQAVDSPDGIRVESFKNEEHVLAAISVNSEAFQLMGITPKIIGRIYGNPSRVLATGNVKGYVLYRGEKPVATASTIFSANGAGIYWVGTIPEAQRSGLGSLCTRLATNAGFQNGASVVTLQASPYGESIYLRLGYKTYDRLKWYLCPKAS
jgi:ribosomal protein S18 acetylase RimI-like enzyme